MSFISINPLSATKISKTPPLPFNGTRGIYPKDDGWHDIDDDGTVKRLAYEDDIPNKATESQAIEGTNDTEFITPLMGKKQFDHFISASLVNTPEIYTKETIDGMNTITGMKHGDMCIILSGNTSAQSIYRYYTKDINGNALSSPQWVWLTDLSLFAPQPVQELTMEITDDGLNKLTWDYSKGNTAKTSEGYINLFYINNVKSGDYGVIDDYGGFLNNWIPNSSSGMFPDSYAPPPDWDYLAPNANQHYRYSFFYDGSKFDWNRSVRNND